MARLVCWPDSQNLGDYAGFTSNCTLINSEYALEKYGPATYLVDENWYDDLEMGRLELMDGEEASRIPDELEVDYGFSDIEDEIYSEPKR